MLGWNEGLRAGLAPLIDPSLPPHKMCGVDQNCRPVIPRPENLFFTFTMT
jgi:hypothetical protein